MNALIMGELGVLGVFLGDSVRKWISAWEETGWGWRLHH